MKDCLVADVRANLIISIDRSGYDRWWVTPFEHEETKKVIQTLPKTGLAFIGTAGPRALGWVVTDARYPYPDNIFNARQTAFSPGIAGLAAAERAGIRTRQVHTGMRNLRVERLQLWRFHNFDPLVPGQEQYEAILSFVDEGLVRHVGLLQSRLQRSRKLSPTARLQRQRLTQDSHQYETKVPPYGLMRALDLATTCNLNGLVGRENGYSGAEGGARIAGRQVGRTRRRTESRARKRLCYLLLYPHCRLDTSLGCVATYACHHVYELCHEEVAVYVGVVRPDADTSEYKVRRRRPVDVLAAPGGEMFAAQLTHA